MQLSLVDLSHSLEPCWVIVSGNSFILSFWLSGYVFMPSANVVHLYWVGQKGHLGFSVTSYGKAEQTF